VFVATLPASAQIRNLESDRTTGGLPTHLDTIAEALAYTDLNSASTEPDISAAATDAHLPTTIVEGIMLLATADVSRRANTLLRTLCILEQGELLSVIKRIVPECPLWPGHAMRLEDVGLLDVIVASPRSYEPQRLPVQTSVRRCYASSG
jgi:hypothetical protein